MFSVSEHKSVALEGNQMENSSVKVVCNSTSSHSSSDEHSRRCKELGRVYYVLLAAKTLSIEHRRLQAWALPGLFQIMHTHMTSTGREHLIYSMCMLTHAQTYI